MYSDWMFLLIIIAFIFSLWAQFRVKGTFKKWLSLRTAPD